MYRANALKANQHIKKDLQKKMVTKTHQYSIWTQNSWLVASIYVIFEWPSTLQSMMNAKLNLHGFWHCHEKGIIKRRFKQYPTAYT